MKEEFLHFIWRTQQFNKEQLHDHAGQTLAIKRAGNLQSNSGPDFFNAQVKIGDTLWAGDVEVHLKSSDWNKHRHQTDRAYDKVILHVVWENDELIKRQDQSSIATLELKGRIKKSLLDNYAALMASENWIPCESMIKSVDPFFIDGMKQKTLIERLEQKYLRIQQIFELNNNDWEASLYQLIGRNFGFKVNNLPFELLITSISYKLIRKYQSEPKKLEALLYGQAGFFNKESESTDDYFKALSREYTHLQKLHHLKPLDRSLWKFSRMRPANFPTLRIAQLVQLFAKNQGFFSSIIRAGKMELVREILKVKTSKYWENHYQFNKETNKTEERVLGDSSIELIMINTIIPLIFTYGKIRGEESHCERALHFLDRLKAESNSIIKHWKTLEVQVKSAADSQALLQLKNEHCNFKKCLSCSIGHNILKTTKHD